MKNLYQTKNIDYYSHIRMDIVNLLPHNSHQKILEVGAGGAYTLHYIKENRLASEVAGVELFELPGTFQNNTSIDKFIIADIEKDSIDLPLHYFDVVICGDVLEHLTDPWQIVNKLSAYLKQGGIFVISVPNIREILTLYKIIFKADFKYSETGGILDKTHLRFFCKKNAIDLLNTSKLKVISYHSSLDLIKKLTKKKILNLFSLGLIKDFLTVQHLVIAKKIDIE